MTATLTRHLVSVLGPAVPVRESHPGAVPLVTPPATDAVAQLLGTATAEGWSVAIRGTGGWQLEPSPADVILGTEALVRPPQIDAADLVATVPAGVLYRDLQQRLASHGVWWPVDPPGDGRSVGSVIATATDGPLAYANGPVRDHILGLTVVTGDGRVIRPGGRVVKNVAGYDLTRLVTGAFGAFGVVTSAHLRLRAAPERDETIRFRGDWADLLPVADAARDAVPGLTALTLTGRGQRAELAIRLAGPADDVEISAQRARSLRSGGEHLRSAGAAAVWDRLALDGLAASVTARVGYLPTRAAEVLQRLSGDHVIHVSASPGRGSARWTAHHDASAFRALRRDLLDMQSTVVLERAPDAVRQRVSHFPVVDEVHRRISERIRAGFDPGATIRVPLEGDP